MVRGVSRKTTNPASDVRYRARLRREIEYRDPEAVVRPLRNAGLIHRTSDDFVFATPAWCRWSAKSSERLQRHHVRGSPREYTAGLTHTRDPKPAESGNTICRMTTKERLHRLVDTLTDREAEDALRLLDAEHQALIGSEPPGQTDEEGQSALAALPEGWVRR